MRFIEIFRRGQKPMSRAPPREQAAQPIAGQRPLTHAGCIMQNRHNQGAPIDLEQCSPRRPNKTRPI
jgi:hypothetical protein